MTEEIQDDSYLIEQPIEQNQPIPPSEVERQLQNQVYQEERVSNFISQTSPVSALNRLNYVLQGYIYDQAENQWKKVAIGIPDEMRKDIIQFLTPDLSEEMRMTRMEEKQINGIMESVIDFMSLYLYSAPEEMEIKEIDRIFWIVIKATFITVMRSRNGVESGKLYNSLTLGGQVNPDMGNKESKDWWRFWK